MLYHFETMKLLTNMMKLCHTKGGETYNYNYFKFKLHYMPYLALPAQNWHRYWRTKPSYCFPAINRRWIAPPPTRAALATPYGLLMMPEGWMADPCLLFTPLPFVGWLATPPTKSRCVAGRARCKWCFPCQKFSTNPASLGWHINLQTLTANVFKFIDYYNLA